MRFYHGEAGFAEYTVLPDGLFFDSYNRVFVAFNHVAENHRTQGTFFDYAGKALVAGYDAGLSKTLFYHEETKYFGQSAAITYIDWGGDAANLYVGGSIDTRCKSFGGSVPCWKLAITRMFPTGTVSGSWSIGVAGSINADSAPFIDNIGVNERLHIFGTTRSHDALISNA